MRWNEIKKDETLNIQFNKLKDIIFAYFKGTIKDKIGHNSNDDLVEKFPLEYTNAKLSLLIEIFRRTVQEGLNEKFPVLNDYVYQDDALRWADPDPDDAAAYLRKLYDDPAEAKRMAAGAKAFIQERHSLERIAGLIRKRYDEICEKLVAEGRVTRSA